MDLQTEENDKNTFGLEECKTETLPVETPQDFVRKVVAESLGTFFMIFFGCGSVIVDNTTKTITHVGVSLVWGMVVMIVIYAFSHISGAHLNPAITLALAATGKFPLRNVPAYMASQVGASIAGVYAARAVLGKNGGSAPTVPAGSYVDTFLTEFLITFFLMMVVSSLATRQREAAVAPVVIGTTVTVNVIVAGPISGASMNPARTIGSAVAGAEYRGLWIYMLAPPFASLFATFTSSFLHPLPSS